MMISSPSAGGPYAAAAALDRQLRASGNEPVEGSSDGTTPDAGPDVVVTLSRGASTPTTYNASGKLSGAPTLDDRGANAPDSLARATESVGDDNGTPEASSASDVPVDAEQDAAVPA